MSVTHHPSDAVLMAYSAGTLGDGLALVVATHLAACPRCRGQVMHLETIGGALLEDIAPMDMNEGALDTLLARLDDLPTEAPRPPAPPPDTDLKLGFAVPAPLRARLTEAGTKAAWRFLAPGIRQIVLPTASGPAGASVRLLRVSPGQKVPLHSHRGLELTLVLDGGFTDAGSHFEAGDLAEIDHDEGHQPVTDPGRDCICLVAVDAPIDLRGPILGPIQRLLGL